MPNGRTAGTGRTVQQRRRLRDGHRHDRASALQPQPRTADDGSRNRRHHRGCPHPRGRDHDVPQPDRRRPDCRPRTMGRVAAEAPPARVRATGGQPAAVGPPTGASGARVRALTAHRGGADDGTPLPLTEGEAYRSFMRFQVLGPVEVNRDTEIIPLGGPKQRLVLAHLLIRANQLVSAETLIDEIWGEEPPDAARGSLHSYVSHLKKALGAERLISRPPGYVLRVASDELDAARFETLAEQARRLGGDPAGAARAAREGLRLFHRQPL